MAKGNEQRRFKSKVGEMVWTREQLADFNREFKRRAGWSLRWEDGKPMKRIHAVGSSSRAGGVKVRAVDESRHVPSAEVGPEPRAEAQDAAEQDALRKCRAAGTHMLRCTGDGYCKVCFCWSPEDDAQLLTVTLKPATCPGLSLLGGPACGAAVNEQGYCLKHLNALGRYKAVR